MKKSIIAVLAATLSFAAFADDGVSAVRQGNYSVATGNGSVAVGMHAEANANLATATGPHAKADGVTSQAFGSDAYAKGYSTTAIGKGTLAEGSASTAVGAHATSIGNSSVAMGLHAKSQGGQSTAVGQASLAEGDQSTAIGSGAITKARFSTALGTNAKANNYLDVAVGSGSETEKAVGTVSSDIDGVTYGNYAGHRPTSTVSVGKEGFERTITNVAAGRVTSESTDAVNGSQLFAVAKKVNANSDAIAENANSIYSNSQSIGDLWKVSQAHSSWNEAQDDSISILNQRIDNLNELIAGVNGDQAKIRQELHDSRREARAGVAGALAVASLMQPYEAGQSAVSVGAGTFRNEGAVALGASHITSNGKWGFKGGVFADTRKHWGAGVAAAYFFGGVKRVTPAPVVIKEVVREVVVREVQEAPKAAKIRQ